MTTPTGIISPSLCDVDNNTSTQVPTLLDVEVEKGEMRFGSAVSNISNTIIGTGTLTMPCIFARCGWVLTNAIMVFVGIVAIFSSYLLVVASDKVNGARSFESLGLKTCGTFGAKYAQFTFIFGGLGTITSYLMFLGQIIQQVVGLADDKRYIPIVLVTIFVLVPLTWPTRIDALRHTSFFGVLSILFVTTMFFWFWLVIGKYGADYKPISPFVWNAHSIDSINLLVGAFCLQNTCLPIYHELEVRSPSRWVMAVVCSVCICGLLYEIIGFSGYALLGANVKSDSLMSLDDNFVRLNTWTEVPRDVAKVAMVFMISTTVPLAIWPCRSAICSLITPKSSSSSAKLFHSTTICVLIVSATFAMLLPDIVVPLGVVNSLAGGSMIFIMPGLFTLGSIKRQTERSFLYFLGWAMVAFGVVFCALGFSLEMRSILTKR